MSIKFSISDEDVKRIKGLYLKEDKGSNGKKFCHSGNVKNLEEIIGDDDISDYVEGVQIRKNGVKGLTDKIELLKTMRLHPKISDGGEHLAYEVMNNLKSYRPYRYFDDVSKECLSAMDKIIEAYKENEHGEELVKDLEKIYAHHHLSPKAKEFIKWGISYAKGE